MEQDGGVKGVYVGVGGIVKCDGLDKGGFDGVGLKKDKNCKRRDHD